MRQAAQIVYSTVTHGKQHGIKAFLWNQWRLPRTKVKKLKPLGIGHQDAMMLGNTRKGAWRISRTPTLNFALPQSLFVRKKGLLLLG